VNVRVQDAVVFHLDKCIGCHTCSLACKNIWTDRRGTEYMWWNNVETKPGTGYPTLYEDQGAYRGGWRRGRRGPRLRLRRRPGLLGDLFFNPRLPALDDYYEPFGYRYDRLIEAPAGGDQPVAEAVSLVTGRPLDIEAGPNWDDDLGGSPIYAARDPNLAGLGEDERLRMSEPDRLAFFYLPRICNHCLNPSCVAACPSGAIYKRAGDGIVLVSQDKCRGWRMCVSGCPYKKVYFNWRTGKSEKCILCYPRQETGQAPACMHACVGRIRYAGLLLYDAGGVAAAANRPDAELVAAQRELVLDPSDPAVVRAAQAAGVPDATLEEARRSPVYRFFKEWKLALPLHPEYRTLPMLFYVPPLLPAAGTLKDGLYDVGPEILAGLENARLPVAYFARLLAAGNENEVLAACRKLVALRLLNRAKTVGDVAPELAAEAVRASGSSAAELEEIERLTTTARFEERLRVPPFLREEAVGAVSDPGLRRAEAGAGRRRPPKRGW
jgi:nitrate reductase / nitrite oxidoreductase, beta subunit